MFPSLDRVEMGVLNGTLQSKRQQTRCDWSLTVYPWEAQALTKVNDERKQLKAIHTFPFFVMYCLVLSKCQSKVINRNIYYAKNGVTWKVIKAWGLCVTPSWMVCRSGSRVGRVEDWEVCWTVLSLIWSCWKLHLPESPFLYGSRLKVAKSEVWNLRGKVRNRHRGTRMFQFCHTLL